jgi:uncharacterized protein (TIGR02391 family)
MKEGTTIMLDLEPRLDPRLWAAIANAYQTGNYTTAILDSIHFIAELIREKTGLEADGVALAGEAFGGPNPKLKVTKLQTDSDKNVQQGILQVLQGIYQAIRNPRSHEKYSDSVQDAEASILFMNYLVTTINKATGHGNRAPRNRRGVVWGRISSEAGAEMSGGRRSELRILDQSTG